jgi:fructoselysine-6-P-deglycase FrlB-like protein
MSSRVEATLRTQRDAWREITERVSTISSREFPHEQPKRILLFGVGSSHSAARLTGFALMRDKTRVRIPVIACSSMSIGSEILPHPGDWAFAFSHRASGNVTMKALETCDRAGAFTVLVTAQGNRPPEYARYALHTVPRETVEPHTAAVTGAICAVTTLLVGAKAVEEWDALRTIGEPDVDVFRRRAGKGPDVLLGEWEGEWIAREGALKLMEMAKIPVRAYGSEEYFHGIHHAARPEDRLWHISMPKDPRNSQIRPAHQIGIFGATPLAWVPALVEIQWLALAVALNLGVDPDVPSAS